MTALAQPWTIFPNPGFLPLSEQVKNIHMVPSLDYARGRFSSQTAPKGFKPRRSPLARDHFGFPLRKGEVVLSTTKSPEILFIEEIVLDDGRGNPHIEAYGDRFYLELATGQIYSRRYSSTTGSYESRPVDMDWWGSGLGLVGSQRLQKDPANGRDCMELGLQLAKIRGRQVHGDKKLRNLSQDLVVSPQATEDLNRLEGYMDSLKVPHID